VRIVYFGTSGFAVPALRAIAAHVVLVVSQPDRPSGRGKQLRPSPIKAAAESLSLLVETPERARSPEFVSKVAALAPDALVVASYGQILSEQLLGAARIGGINIHASVLPKYRGAAPIQWAILMGKKETGVTLMQMDKGMDTGDTIAVERTQIGEDETAGELEARLAGMGAELLGRWLERLNAGDYPRTPQNERQASMAPKLLSADGELSAGREAETEYRRFRATTPRPGAFVQTRFGALKILEARLGAGSGGKGEILNVSGAGIEVAFVGGSLAFARVQLPGKPAVPGRDFANGARLKAGQKVLP
jgi:methionyl-tRNA formyltransferase